MTKITAKSVCFQIDNHGNIMINYKGKSFKGADTTFSVEYGVAIEYSKNHLYIFLKAGKIELKPDKYLRVIAENKFFGGSTLSFLYQVIDSSFTWKNSMSESVNIEFEKKDKALANTLRELFFYGFKAHKCENVWSFDDDELEMIDEINKASENHYVQNKANNSVDSAFESAFSNGEASQSKKSDAINEPTWNANDAILGDNDDDWTKPTQISAGSMEKK